MAFNINAQVVLSGPKNIKAVTNTIRQQLGNVSVNVALNVPKNAQQQITNLNNQLTNVANTATKANAGASKFGKNLSNVGRSTKQAASAMQQLGQETALTFKRFAAAGIVTATFFRMTQSISEAVPKALELQREFIKLQQVTGKTQDQLSGLKGSVIGLSKSLGLEANELAGITRIFAQTGQSLNQIEASMKAVARASLAPTFGSMEQTAEGLIAALNQFQISASQSEAVLASINRVSKKFAVESEDLIAAIRRAGGVFAIAAGQFAEPQEALNQFLGIFTAVRSTTRETAETIATGLRTIFSRIQRPQTIDFLQELGINLKDAQGNFVGLFESFRILSKELDTVISSGDALALAKITEELGGIRQVGKLIPAIREFRKAEQAFIEAQKGAVEGLGSDVALGVIPLAKQFEQLQSRFQALIQTISDSSTFQVFAKTALGLANAFLSLAESLTPLLPTLTTLAGLKISQSIGGFASGFFGSFKKGGGISGAGSALGGGLTGQGSQGNTAAVQNQTTVINNNITALTNNTTSLTNLSSAINTLQTSIATLNNTIRSMPLQLGGGLQRRRGFASGGLVPGTGNRDTVPAMLTPGEYVVRKSAVKGFGAGNLADINGYNGGGKVIADINSRFGIGTIRGAGDRSLATTSIKLSEIRSKNTKDAKAVEDAYLAAGGGRQPFQDGLSEQEQSLFNDALAGNLELGTQSKTTEGLIQKIADGTKSAGIKVANAQGKDISISSTVLRGKSSGNEDLFRGKAGRSRLKSLAGELQNAKVGRVVPFGATVTASGGNLVSLNADAKSIFTSGILNEVPNIVRKSVNKILPQDQALAADSPAQIAQLLSANEGAIGSFEGFLFESFIRDLTQDLIEQDSQGPGRFDVPNPISDNINRLFNSPQFPLELKNDDNLANLASSYGKAISVLGFQTFAKGGAAKGSDTVPAMLTPGEYVINRGAAESFGYGNLNKINRYNQGGVVKRGRYNYGTPGGAMGQAAAQRNAGVNNLSSEADKAATSAANLAAGQSNVLQAMMTLSFGVQGVVASLHGFKDGVDAVDLLNLATQVAVIGPSLKELPAAFGSIKAMLTGSTAAVAANTTANTANTAANVANTASEVAETGANLASAKSEFVKGLKGGFKNIFKTGKGAKNEVSSLVTDFGDLIGDAGKKTGRGGGKVADFVLGKDSLARKGVAKAGRGVKGAIKLPGALGKGVSKQFGTVVGKFSKAVPQLANLGGKLAAGGIAGAVVSAIAGPLVDGVTNAFAGAKEEIIPGVSGRRGMSGEDAGAIEGIGGAIKGAATGAAMGAIFGPVGAAIGAVVGGLFSGAKGLITGAAKQIEFNAILDLQKGVKSATEALDEFIKASSATPENLKKLNKETTAVIQGFDRAAIASRKSVEADQAFSVGGQLGTMKDSFGTGGGVAVGTLAGAGAGAALGAVVGSVVPLIGTAVGAVVGAIAGAITGFVMSLGAESARIEAGAKSFDRAASQITPEFLDKLAEGFGKLATDLANQAADVEGAEAFLNFKVPEGAIKGFNQLIAAVDASAGALGPIAGEYKEFINTLLNANLIGAVRDEAEILGEEGGKELKSAFVRLRTSGFDFASASTEQITAKLKRFGITNKETVGAITSVIQKQKDQIAEQQAAASAAAKAAKLLREMRNSIDALAAGLDKFVNISSGAADKFSAFVSEFEQGFEAAFSSDAKLLTPERINPFENIDASTPEEIEKAFQRITASAGGGAGGPNEAAFEGLQATIESTRDLPFALKGALESIGGESAVFESPEALIAAVRDNLDGFSDLPADVRGAIESGIKGEFSSRQGQGTGPIKIGNLLSKDGEVNKALNELAEKTVDAAAKFTDSLNTMEKAVIQAAQIQINLINKQKEAANKKLAIDERAAKITGENKGRDALEVANEGLANRINIQQGGNVAGVATANPLDVASLGRRRDELAQRGKDIRQQLGIGADVSAEQAATLELEGQNELVKQLAEVTAAEKGTQQALETLADDTSRLAAVQSNIEKLEKSKLSAEQTFDNITQELQQAFASGDVLKIRELQNKLAAPAKALEKAQKGEALSFEEAALLKSKEGQGILRGTGLQTDEQIEELNNNAGRAILQSDAFGVALQGFGGPQQDFIKSREGLGRAFDDSDIEVEREKARQIAGEQKAAVDSNLGAAEKKVAEMQAKYNDELINASVALQFAGDELRRFRELALQEVEGTDSDKFGEANQFLKTLKSQFEGRKNAKGEDLLKTDLAGNITNLNDANKKALEDILGPELQAKLQERMKELTDAGVGGVSTEMGLKSLQRTQKGQSTLTDRQKRNLANKSRFFGEEDRAKKLLEDKGTGVVLDKGVKDIAPPRTREEILQEMRARRVTKADRLTEPLTDGRGQLAEKPPLAQPANAAEVAENLKAINAAGLNPDALVDPQMLGNLRDPNSGMPAGFGRQGAFPGNIAEPLRLPAQNPREAFEGRLQEFAPDRRDIENFGQAPIDAGAMLGGELQTSAEAFAPVSENLVKASENISKLQNMQINSTFGNLQIDLNAAGANNMIQKAMELYAMEQIEAKIPEIKEQILSDVKSQMLT